MYGSTLIPFEHSAYRSQISRLKKLAAIALTNYPFKVKSIKFINHGENSTFKVTSTTNKSYLLRIHRNGYHTAEALNEELIWLERLRSEKILCPKPIKARSKKLIVEAFHPLVGARRCTLLTWQDGKFFENNLTPKICYEWGRLVATLQVSGQFKIKHRRYWTADGLLSKNSRFGSVEKIEDISKREQKILSNARLLLHRKIRSYEKKYSDRAGLIHADLHFGNFFKTKHGLFPIDFDDCGYGFHAYDLCVPLLNIILVFNAKKKPDKAEACKRALIEGFKSVHGRWDEADEIMLHNFMAARMVMMIGWINSRKDNPRIRKLLKARTARTISFLSDHKII